MLMLKDLSKKFSKKLSTRLAMRKHPLKPRWDYFNEHSATIPAAISLIESAPEHHLRDINFLENELIPALGLNDENLNEQPKELEKFFGTGLHVFQYPNQLARYMVWLADHAHDAQTYVEIGSRWGGTFILVTQWLLRIGAPLNSVVAIDPIGETPLLQVYGNHLSAQGVRYQFVRNSSTSPEIKSLFASLRPDFVFIDGDHSLIGALADHMLARQSANIIVHHDVSSDACPETTALWNALKDLEAHVFTATEFTEQYLSVEGSFLGIGVLKRKAL